MTATKFELFLAGSWTDITSYVRQDPGAEITFGIQNEGSVANAATCTIVVNNTDGRFTPRNTAGAYYGNLHRNTPLRVTAASGTVRFVGEIPEFDPRWDESGNNVWVNITASGILRRLQHGSTLASTLTYAVLALAAQNSDIVGYWPMEDSVGSTMFASAFPDGIAAAIGGSPVLEAVDLGAGTHNVPTFGGAYAGFLPTTTAAATKFTAGFYCKLPATGGGLTGGEELFRVDVNGTAKSWRVLYTPGSGGGVFVQVISSTGVEILDSSSITGLDGQTFYCKIECSNSGSNVAYALSTLGAGTTVSGTLSSAAVGTPLVAYVGAGVIAIPAAAAVAIGHVALGNTDNALLHSTFDSGRSGYAGESVETRMARLATQSGVPITVVSGTLQATELGAQPDGTLLDVLRATEKADAGGILRDSISAVELVYITRNGRYNALQAQLVLDYSAGQVSPPLEPTDDDQQIRNDVTASRDNGSSARKVLASGALSTAAYPSGVGLYPFADSYAVNTDSQLPYLAGWILALGTIDETRWPAVTVDLIANPSLVTSAEGMRPGYRLQITNLPTYAGTATVNLQVLGWQETITAARHNMTFICAPGSIWLNRFTLGDATYGVLGTNKLNY